MQVHRRLFCFTVLTILLLSANTLQSQNGAEQSSPVLEILLNNDAVIIGTVHESRNDSVKVHAVWMREYTLASRNIKRISIAGRTRIQLMDKLQIELVDKKGARLMGLLHAATSDTIYLKTKGGIALSVPQDKIKFVSATVVSGDHVKAHNSRPIYFARDRLFLNSTGLMPEPGEVYLSMYYVIFPMVTIGITEWASVSAFMTLFPNTDSQAYIFNPRISILRNDHSGLSFSYTAMKLFEKEELIHSFTMVGALGTENIAFSLGAGLLLDDDNILQDIPFISIGLDLRMTKHARFISEHMLFPQSDGNVVYSSFGFRMHGKHFAVDIACVGIIYERNSSWPFFPLLTLKYKF